MTDQTVGALEGTVDFMSKAFPNPTSKNAQTQMGVHFEEVAEMIAELRGSTSGAQLMLQTVLQTMSSFATFIKQAPAGTVYVPAENSLAFLDSIADQLVTAAGSAVVHGMDPVGALHEVNRSNFSKFDAQGRPIHHPETHKLMKGPNYSEPNLAPFIPG
jgi:predicted HAD superfamily Cof-like phosphohydrolase